MKKAVMRGVTLAAALSLAAVLAACSSPGSSTGTPAASGGAQSLADLNIGFFSPGTSNTYAATVTSGAEDKAKELGVKLTTQSANFDPQTQVNQLQQALQRKTYNAWIVVPVDPTLECDVITQAVAQGIKVEMAVAPACTDTGPEGGLGISAVQNLDYYEQWWEYIFTHSTPGKVALVTGAPLDQITIITEKALDNVLPKHPDFTVVSNQNLDYSTSAANANAQAVLQANPDLTVFASNYSGMTQGVAQAIDQAGLKRKVKLYDFDGDKTMADMIKAGDVEMTIPGLPASESGDAVQIVVDDWQGKPTEKVNNPLAELTFDGAPFLTKENIDQFTPQY
jgi:ribose transport system substrate-binding protein